jgi:coenzyme PQQ precursor peptide PqqA
MVPRRRVLIPGTPSEHVQQVTEETIMAWTTPTLVEICIGLEINGYLPAEF